jgi:hypothetical protein
MTAAKVWNLLIAQNMLPGKASVYHLLWTLQHLKMYCSQTASAMITRVCEKTYRDWVKKFLEALRCVSVQYIRWGNRFMNDVGCTCLVTVDGTDCKIQEPTPFSRGWYSHKSNGPGVRYEVGLCIQTGWIVWVNGPFPCGEWLDLRIAREGIVHHLLPGEMFIADGGYCDGGEYFNTPNGLNNEEQGMQSLARSRHETVNKRLKQFKVIDGVYRHSIESHGTCFHTIALLTQISLEDERLFQIDYAE